MVQSMLPTLCSTWFYSKFWVLPVLSIWNGRDWKSSSIYIAMV